MNTCGCAICKWTTFIGHIDPLLIHGVTRLVHDTEEIFSKEMFLDARGDPHISERELGHERMMGLINAAAVEVVTERTDDILCEFDLLRFGEIPMQAGIISSGLGS